MAGVWIRRPAVKEPFDIRGSAQPDNHNPTAAGMQLGDASSKFDCPVCLESFNESDPNAVYTTSCGHKICRTCLDKCLQTSMACPICRNVLLNEKAQLGFPFREDNMLGLFILNPSFFAVPGSTVLLRVFEPRYLILVKRCIRDGTCFGLQAGFRSRRGVLIAIKRHRELPEGHIIMEGLVVARYEAFDGSCEPVEEPDTFGLYRMRSRILVDRELSSGDQETMLNLNRRADELLQERFNELSRYEKDVIGKICGSRPSSSSYEFSFWLLGALYSPESKADMLFNPNAVDRITFCIKLLEENQPFECLLENQ